MVELAHFAYRDPKDPERLDMQKDMRNAQNPFDVKVDDWKICGSNFVDTQQNMPNVPWMTGS